MKRILVTGGSGLLGSKIVKVALKGNEVTPTYHAHPFFSNSRKLDVTNRRETSYFLEKSKPDVVVHTAAETNVDRCETDKNWAWKVNTEGTETIARACEKIKAKLVYVSTDYVFDGKKGFYCEDAQTRPVNYYGYTKLKGEKFLKECCTDYLIVRTSVLYGWHPWKTNFATWVVGSLRSGKGIEVVDNHYNSPTLADNLAEALLEMVKRGLSGVYHTAGRDRISRYEFARAIARTFDLETNLIKPIKMSELRSWIAKRPRDSSLSISRVQKQLRTRFLNVSAGLGFMKNAEKEQ